MHGETRQTVDWGFWVVGSLALVWNLAGVVNFFAQMNPEILESYRESEIALVESRPAWATGMFALAVLAGSLGSIFLLLRRAAAVPLFIASFLGVLGTMAYSLSAGIDFGVGEIMGIIMMPLFVAAFLIWFSKFAVRQGWICY